MVQRHELLAEFAIAAVDAIHERATLSDAEFAGLSAYH
jgi:hypothetical protein